MALCQYWDSLTSLLVLQQIHRLLLLFLLAPVLPVVQRGSVPNFLCFLLKLESYSSQMVMVGYITVFNHSPDQSIASSTSHPCSRFDGYFIVPVKYHMNLIERRLHVQGGRSEYTKQVTKCTGFFWFPNCTHQSLTINNNRWIIAKFIWV